MCGGSKGQSQSNTSQTSTYSPNPQAAGAITGALNQAQNTAQLPFNVPQAPVAGFSQDQQTAFGNINQAQGMAQPYINQAQQYFSPQGAQAFANPYIDAVTAQMQNIFGQQNQQNNSNLVQSAGGVGADRIAVGQGNLANQQALAAGQTYSGIYNNAVQQAQGAGYGTAALGSQAQNAALSGAQAQLASGGLQQQLQQAQLNAPYQQQLAQAMFPYQQSNFLTNAVASLAPGLGGTTTGQGTGSQTPAQPSIWSQILGAGTAGAGLFGSLGGFNGGAAYQNSTGNYMGMSDAGQDALQDAGYPLPNARGGRIGAFADGGTPNPYDIGGMASDDPIDISKGIVPQGQTAHIAPTIPQVNLTPPQQQQQSGGGFGDILKTAAQFLPMLLASGGSVSRENMKRFDGHNPYSFFEPKGYADGGAPDDDEPFRMPDAESVEAWRQGADADIAAGRTKNSPQLPAAITGGDAPPAPTQALSYAGSPTRSAAPQAAAPAAAATAAFPGTRPSDDDSSNFARNPWTSLIAAGAGMMSGTSPFAGVNIGQGLGAGLKSVEQQRTDQQKDTTIAQAAKRLELEAKHHEDQYTRLTAGQKQAADLAHLPYQQMTAAQKAADERARTAADQDEWVPAGTIETEDGKSHPAVMEKSTGTIMDAVTGKPPGEGASVLAKGAKKPISDQDARDVAERYIDSGNRMVLSGLGYSGDNRTKVNQQIKKVQDEKGISNQELATREAEWEGRKAGQRVLAQQEAKMGSAAFEAEGAIKIARPVIEKVPRTNFLPFNKLIEGYQKQTLDPDQVELLGRLRAISNTYAAVMNRGASVVTDTARHHADDLLNSAGNAASMNRALDTMSTEIDMAKHSPDRMRRFYRQQYGEKSLGAEDVTPAPAAAPAGAPPPAASPQDQQALAWAKANPNDPRAAKIMQRLGVQ